MATAPDELSSIVLCWSIPPGEPFPAEHHGAPVCVVAAVYSGLPEDGEAVVQPLRGLATPLIDLSGPWPWVGLQSGFDALFPKGGLYYWKSKVLAELTDIAIDEIVGYGERDAVCGHRHLARRRMGPSASTTPPAAGLGFLVTGGVSWSDRRRRRGPCLGP
jgi:hypothetical protein